MGLRSFFTVALAGLGLGLPVSVAIPSGLAVPASTPDVQAPAGGPAVSQDSLQRLSSMFSPQIQTTVAACWEQGKVNLQTTPVNGWVVCQDGSVVEGVTYNNYLSTVADVMAASTLVGLRTAMDADPRLTPQVLATFVNTDQGSQLLQNIVQSAIVQGGLQPGDRLESAAVLTDAVVLRLVDNLQDPTRLNSLLGTPEQYTQTVGQFCASPGMDIAAAQQQIGLDAIQLYAVCIEESGTMQEAVRQLY
ncbi:MULTISPECIES: hypothetical protein [unclassified Leptolyngbya]|uniref:hypothetical protein n=1 Tax=unclassified Leptolyngbya TaxID=2650499 RepID=UPI0016894E4E|nr:MULTISPECIES: hypothetical protein [unclassified Leptolyngbya]MBD1912895.1 hypothetical protein [Leptolyngbya sp. FACHB-8]MBD2154776.1 hypothetical protein [Leptolyngbya sp. FACHB-16]